MLARYSLFAILAGGVLVTAGCSETSRAQSDRAEQGATQPKSQSDDGVATTESTQHLLDVIETLETRQPQGSSRGQMVANFQETQQQIIQAADKILASKVDEKARVTAVEAKLRALGLLMQTDAKDAADNLRKYAESVAKDDNPQIVRAARHQLAALGMVALLEGKPDAAAGLVDDLKALFALGKPDAQMLELARQSAMVLEHSDQPKLALEVYEQIAKQFANASDKALAKAAAMISDSAQRRLSLIGKPLVVEGTLLDGKPLDWKQYKGKVVLLDFWATWCGPCLNELPNVRENYERYHDKGFEVLGVSLDDDQVVLDQFMTEQKIPWPTLFGEDAKTRGFEMPLARKFGVESIPMAFLVDQEGKLVTVSARGKKLGEYLEKLLGPATRPAGGAE